MAEADDWIGPGGAEADDWIGPPAKRTALENLAAPVTTYPEHLRDLGREARETMSSGVKDLATPTDGDVVGSLWQSAKGVAKLGAGAFNYAISPGMAAIRSGLSKPLEDVAGVPKEYTEFGASLAVPGMGLTRLPGAAARAESQALIKMTAKADTQAGVTAQKAADEFGINYSKGEALADPSLLRRENLAGREAEGKEAQAIAQEHEAQRAAGVTQASQDISEQVGRGVGTTTPRESAEVLGSEVGGQGAAARGDLAALDTEAAAHRGIVEDQGRALQDIVRGDAPAIESPREVGEIATPAIRDAARTQREAANAAYGEAYGREGEFAPQAFENIGNRIRLELANGEHGIQIEEATTPRANRALNALNDLENFRLPGANITPTTPPMDLRGVEQARKRLTFAYRDARRAGDPARADAFALQHAIERFDDSVERAVTNGMFSGDPAALDALQAARTQYRDYARAFRPQGSGDDVGNAMRKIIDRNATPEEVTNFIIGTGKIGQSGLAARMAERLQTVLGPQSDAWGAIKQGILQKSGQVRTAAGEIDAVKSAQGMIDLGESTLGRRIYGEAGSRAIREQGHAMRNIVRSVDQVGGEAKAARESYQQFFAGEGIGGPPQKVFQRMVEGTASPEEIAGAAFNVAGNTTAGNTVRFIDSVATLTGENSAAMNAIRSGAFQQLTKDAFTKNGPQAQALTKAMDRFLKSSVARRLYAPDELAKMTRFQKVLERLVIPPGARTNSDTVPAAMSMMHRIQETLATKAVMAIVPKKLKAAARVVGWGMDKLGAEADKARRIEEIRHTFTPFRSRGGRVDRQLFIRMPKR